MRHQHQIDRILIANRGEIAVRVIRACRELGISTVAVYSEADRGALHTRLADEAYLLGPPPATQSYLDTQRILAIAAQSGARAIHPGYGFLAESPEFAEACAAAGLEFIGPPPAAMRLVGDKAAARRLAAEQGVPVVPGYDGADQSPATLRSRAREIGYPLLVKAAAGGGGRGMRIVSGPEGMDEALEGAAREARATFGDGRLILERYVTPARHVEVQILGDRLGSIVHLGERECSVQRRYQKVIEESPAPACTPTLRAALGDAAVRVARAAGYWNAGTCEFLVDADGQFYFIEMNARLQVEHPVTELVTGLDLVALQIAVAGGAPLGLAQEQIAFRGHAVECRLYAEDPARDFLPSGGRLTRFAPPLGPGLRHDVGFATGDLVNTYYDSMLAKLIAYGDDREAALARARSAVDEYVVEGVTTNLPLLGWILRHPRFVSGGATTDFLAREWCPSIGLEATPEALAAAAAALLDERTRPGAVEGSAAGDPWLDLPAWRLLDQAIPLTFLVDGAPRLVMAYREDEVEEPSCWTVVAGEATLRAHRASTDIVVKGTNSVERFHVDRQGNSVRVRAEDGRVFEVVRAGPPSVDRSGRATAADAHAAQLRAPMPGRVARLAVAAGDLVREHQPLVVLEAMKIEHVVEAPRDGVVTAVHCRQGEAVESGAVLVEME